MPLASKVAARDGGGGDTAGTGRFSSACSTEWTTAAGSGPTERTAAGAVMAGGRDDGKEAGCTPEGAAATGANKAACAAGPSQTRRSPFSRRALSTSITCPTVSFMP